MLVLLSFGLVLVATILLVLGLLSDEGLMLIWLSIASSVAAALVLVLALKLNKPRDEVRTTAPEPLPIPEPQPAAALAAPSAATSSMATTPAATSALSSEPDEWLAADQDTWSADDWSGGDEVDFPIADYDTLTSGQILPLLPQLYEDEIPVVEERERSTKARPEILQKLDELRGATTSVEGPAASELEPHESIAPAASASSTEQVAAVDPLASYTEPAAPSWDDDWFPIEDYESLSAAQIRPLLPELDAEELTMVRDKELELGRRRSLLDEIDRLIPGTQAASPAEATFAAPPAEPAPTRAAAAGSISGTSRAARATSSGTSAAKKAATKKAATKKATTKRPTAKKAASSKATTTSSAAAKKATSAKKAATPAKASAKKVTAKNATAKKATAKAAAKKATAKATAKKAAPSKTAAKKAAPAKKATRRPTEG